MGNMVTVRLPLSKKKKFLIKHIARCRGSLRVPTLLFIYMYEKSWVSGFFRLVAMDNYE